MPTISTLTVDVESRTSKFRSGMKLAIGGLAALAAGAAYAFSQFEESEKIQNQTAAALESTGHAARISGKDISDMAQRLAALTGIDDEAIQSGENLLLTFTNIKNQVGGEFTGTFDRATQAIVDMSVAMDQDMKSSAIQVGKALNDPVLGLTSLTRVGVSFSEQTKKQIALLVKHGETAQAQGIILDELAKEFGGSAEAQATASGKMSVAWGNLAETIGGVVAPVFTFLAQKLQAVAEFLMSNVPEAIKFVKQAFSDAMDAVGPFVDLLDTKLTPVIEGVVEWFQKVYDAVRPVAIVIGKELFEAATQVWQVIKQNLWPILEDLWNVLQKLWHIVEPLIKVWLAIQAVWLKIAVEVLPPLLAVIADLIEVVLDVVDAFLTVVNWVKDHFVDPIVGAIEKIISWVKDKLVGAWNAAWDVMLGPIQAVIDKVETLIGWIKSAIEWLGRLFAEGGAAANVTAQTGRPGIGQPPQAASGGFVAQSGLAVIHRGENIIPAGGASGVTVVINGDVTGEEIVRKVRDGLLRLQRRNVTTGIAWHCPR